VQSPIFAATMGTILHLNDLNCRRLGVLTCSDARKCLRTEGAHQQKSRLAALREGSTRGTWRKAYLAVLVSCDSGRRGNLHPFNAEIWRISHRENRHSRPALDFPLSFPSYASPNEDRHPQAGARNRVWLPKHPAIPGLASRSQRMAAWLGHLLPSLLSRATLRSMKSIRSLYQGAARRRATLPLTLRVDSSLRLRPGGTQPGSARWGPDRNSNFGWWQFQ